MPPRPDPDEARECYPPGVDAGSRDAGIAGCRPGELCLEGRCYASCTEDSECGPRERCAPSGACIRSTEGDAGMRDAGPADICDGVVCAGTEVCHPLSGTCVQCNEETAGAAAGMPGHCSGVAPICDIANGACVMAGQAQCSPCISDAECAVPGGFMGLCITREVQGIRERVCMASPAADMSCPSGLSFDAGAGVCVPPIGMPCTNWMRGKNRHMCLADTDCAPLGATSAVYPDACDGEVIDTSDGGVSTAGGCLQPCGEARDCDSTSGQVCTGDPLFCRAPPPSP